MTATQADQPLLGNASELTDRMVPRANPGTTVREVVAALHGNDYASVAAIAILDEDRLMGLVRIEDPLRGRRYWHRLPGLVVGLAGALLAAEIVSAFEARLETTLLLAFFLPGLVYMADAVGTQTETVIVRGLSVGVPIGRVARLELTTGLLVGLTLAAVFVPIGLWRWGTVDVIVTVAVSLIAACSVATIVAMALPALLQRLGTDPAFGSGPLATVAQDLLTILIYLAVAAAIVP